MGPLTLGFARRALTGGYPGRDLSVEDTKSFESCSGNAIALGAQLRMLRGSILKFDRVITAWHRSDETSQRLDESSWCSVRL